MIRTLIFGAGRMAQALLSLQNDFPNVSLAAMVSRSEPSAIKSQQSTLHFCSLDEAHDALAQPLDLVIDFSLPGGTPTAAKWCGEHGVALLSGVTGIDQAAQQALDDASASVPVLWAPNLGFGVNLLTGLLQQAATMIGRDAVITIEETHHEGKKDAPSGTALHLAQQFPGEDRINIDSHREGNVVGEHEVRLDFADESLSFKHIAKDRRLFARGALQAGVWLVAQPPGRYTAGDWISGMMGTGIPGPDGHA